MNIIKFIAIQTVRTDTILINCLILIQNGF